MSHGWEYIGLALVAFHFAVPFIVLLSRRSKRNAAILAGMALWLIAARFLDLFFMIGPEAYPNGLAFHWLDVAAPVGLGGVWVALFLSNLKSRPLLRCGTRGSRTRCTRSITRDSGFGILDSGTAAIVDQLEVEASA